VFGVQKDVLIGVQIGVLIGDHPAALCASGTGRRIAGTRRHRSLTCTRATCSFLNDTQAVA